MNIGFIGFGTMARAMACGFVRAGGLRPEEIGACARDAGKLKTYAAANGFKSFEAATALVGFADVVVVAVKPHQVEEVLMPLRDVLVGKIVVSVAAGWDFARYEALLGREVHHLSTIPNTPVSVGRGIVVCERIHSLTAEEFSLIERLLLQLGLVIAVDTAQLGIAGTICGCAPAFVCMFTEALSDAAVKHGIARADAYRMASQMIVGTGELMLHSGEHPGVLKDAVCSPGGTTIVGVAALERSGFRGAVIDAVDDIQQK